MSMIVNSKEDKEKPKESGLERLWRNIARKFGEETEPISVNEEKSNKAERRLHEPLPASDIHSVRVERDNAPKIEKLPDSPDYLSKTQFDEELKNIRKSLRWMRMLLLLIIGVLLYPHASALFFSLKDKAVSLFSVKPEPPPAAENPTNRAAPVKVAAGTLFADKSDEGASYEALVVNTEKINLFLTDEAGKPFGDFQSLKNWLSKNKQQMVFAMNAGIYGRDIQPLGLHVENGKLIRKLNLSNQETVSSDKSAAGNFFMVPNGVFLIRDGEASITDSNSLKDVSDWQTTKLATQSGPLLLIDNKIHPKFNQSSTNRKIRNGVGVIDKNSVVFIITKEPVTFYDFTMIFKNKFKCKDALYLDGVISNMYLAERDNDNPENDLFAGMFAVSVPFDKNN